MSTCLEGGAMVPQKIRKPYWQRGVGSKIPRRFGNGGSTTKR